MPEKADKSYIKWAWIGLLLFGPNLSSQIVTITGLHRREISEHRIYTMDLCDCSVKEVRCEGFGATITTHEHHAWTYAKVYSGVQFVSGIFNRSHYILHYVDEKCEKSGAGPSESIGLGRILSAANNLRTNNIYLAGDSLFECVVGPTSPNGIKKNFGSLAPRVAEGLNWIGGDLYMLYKNQIFLIDTNDLFHPQLQLTLPYSPEEYDAKIFRKGRDWPYIQMVSYPTECQSWITYLLVSRGVGQLNRGIYRMDITGGTLTPTCPAQYAYFDTIAGSAMLPDTLPCVQLSIDLDMDDSGGASGKDYRVVDYCPEEEVGVSDTDVLVQADGRAPDSIVLHLDGIKDKGKEFLKVLSSPPDIGVRNSANSWVLYRKGEGNVTSFRNALSHVRYVNRKNCPTKGVRQVHIRLFACAYLSEEVVCAIDIPDYKCPGRDSSVRLCKDASTTELFGYLGEEATLGGQWNPKGNFSPSIDSLGVYWYKVERGQCGADSAYVQIALGEVEIELGEDRYYRCMDTVMTIRYKLLTGNPDNVEWYVDGVSYGSANDEISLRPVDFPVSKDVHTVKVVVVDEEGCMNEDSIHLYLREELPFVIPKAFSPNGDNLNDIFRVISKFEGAQITEMAIYNRWGQQMYLMDQLNPDFSESRFWDGNYRGHPASQGIYLYKLQYRLCSGSTGEIKGDVILLR